MSELVQKMASELGYEAAVSDDLDDVDLADASQFAESDMSYVTRLAQKVGAVAKPVDGHLVLANEGSGSSVSGVALAEKTVNASDVVSYSCNFKETEEGGETNFGICNRPNLDV